MANDNLKDFSVNFILFGLLFFSLTIFSVTFIINNNPNSIGDDLLNSINSSSNNLRSNLIVIEGTGNSIANTTSFTDPEASYLGSKDQVATAFDMAGSSKSTWESTKSMLDIVLGENSIIIIGIFSGIVIFMMIYFIIKLLRAGY